MIKIENVDVNGWEAAIRGMRNPMNSWDKSDSYYGCRLKKDRDCVNWDVHEEGEITRCDECGWYDPLCWCTDDVREFIVGENDHDLMTRLAAGGSVHAKYRRMITVSLDITAPLYWWKEFDTYKVGTVANSCSTMHKIHAKEFTPDDFSHEHLDPMGDPIITFPDDYNEYNVLELTIIMLNQNRAKFLETKDKRYWWNMIQLLPSSYNQKRTVLLNYEVLVGIYRWRENHKLDEWREFCKWITSLPYSEIITG